MLKPLFGSHKAGQTCYESFKMLSFILDVTILMLAIALVGFSMELMVPVSYQSTLDHIWDITFRTVFFIGAIIGTRVWTVMFHNKSRTLSLQLGFLLSSSGFTSSWAASCGLSRHWPGISMFCIGRFLNGLACPFLFCSSCILLFESAPETWIDTFGCLPWLSITGAVAVTHATPAYCSWSLAVFFCAFLAFVLSAFFWCLQEPSKSGDYTGPISSDIHIVHPIDLLSGDQVKQISQQDWVDTPRIKPRIPIRITGCFVSGSLQRTLIWLMLLHQFTGVQILSYLAEMLFQFAPSKWSMGYAASVGLPQVMGASFAALLARRIPPIHLLRVSSVLLAITEIFMGITLKYQLLTPTSPYLIGFITFGLGAHSIGWGPIPMLLVNHLYCAEERGWAVGTATLITWVGQLAGVVLFEPLTTVLGIGNYLWFTALLSLSAVFHIQAPETQSLTKVSPRLNFKLKLPQLGRVLQADPESNMPVLSRIRLILDERSKNV